MRKFERGDFVVGEDSAGRTAPGRVLSTVGDATLFGVLTPDGMYEVHRPTSAIKEATREDFDLLIKRTSKERTKITEFLTKLLELRLDFK